MVVTEKVVAPASQVAPATSDVASAAGPATPMPTPSPTPAPPTPPTHAPTGTPTQTTTGAPPTPSPTPPSPMPTPFPTNMPTPGPTGTPTLNPTSAPTPPDYGVYDTLQFRVVVAPAEQTIPTADEMRAALFDVFTQKNYDIPESHINVHPTADARTDQVAIQMQETSFNFMETSAQAVSESNTLSLGEIESRPVPSTQVLTGYLQTQEFIQALANEAGVALTVENVQYVETAPCVTLGEGVGPLQENQVGAGKACAFPFTYRNISYPSCTRTMWDVPWCAVGGQLTFKWGQCSTSCPSVAYDCRIGGGTSQVVGFVEARDDTCVFPFTFKGQQYLSCLQDSQSGLHWCPLKANYTDGDEWGFCNRWCPKAAPALFQWNSPTPPSPPPGSYGAPGQVYSPGQITGQGGVWVPAPASWSPQPVPQGPPPNTVGAYLPPNTQWQGQTQAAGGFGGPAPATPVATQAAGFGGTTAQSGPQWQAGPTSGVSQTSTGLTPGHPGYPCVTMGSEGAGANVPCHFPFVFGYTVYNGCTNVGWNKPWCSVHKGDSAFWGACDPNRCPMATPGGPGTANNGRRDYPSASGSSGSNNDPSGASVQVNLPAAKVEACFPGNAKVISRSGPKDMAEIRLGDEILGFNSATEQVEFSKVHAWLHRNTNTEASYLELHTKDGNIEVSPGHNLAVGSPETYAYAQDIVPGSLLVTPNGTALVTSLSAKTRKGMYAPWTKTLNFYVAAGEGFVLAHGLANVHHRLGGVMNAVFTILEMLMPSIHSFDEVAETDYLHPVGRLFWSVAGVSAHGVEMSHAHPIKDLFASVASVPPLAH
eukprot:gnl/TRDRNA2_/TRDRNA2_67405_c1_seq1.p1 gnl/TRDRNA2_/TRDRNA2_67405_c1~~gnl/TRDRNA2_/TRDRNA2_67405_c1_seq1.p1  ORF type:complete len:830 (-),score=67.49 gnl/TRDRNA2_/TRDRNA2_67405_c1_seq1:82-2541(-)